MKKSRFSPDLVNFTALIIFAFLLYMFMFCSICFSQECADGKCDRSSATQLRQIRWASSDTTDGKKNPAVARMEHDDYKGRGYFTGFFIVAPNGLRTNILVTAAHCFDGPGETRVYLPDGRMFKGEVLALDRIWDVAVVSVEGPRIPAMRLATKPPVRGDLISAYGYGWVGKQYARINGVAIGYSIFKGQRVANTLKCSFKVRDGDSGGPMVNSRCEVVAVISCSDDQSGTHGTWAARIKVIVDKAIARKIKQTSFVSTKEDTGKLPPLPPRVGRPVEQQEAGAADGRVKLAAIEKVTKEKKHNEIPEGSAKAPGTGVGSHKLTTSSDVLALALQVAAIVGGVGLTGGVGWGGWAILKWARVVYRGWHGLSGEYERLAEKSADSFSTLPREAKEARQLLQLSELEGRSPLFDALIGRLTLDELDDSIDGNRPEKDFAVQFKERVMRRFNEIAPVSVEKRNDKD